MFCDRGGDGPPGDDYGASGSEGDLSVFVDGGVGGHGVVSQWVKGTMVRTFLVTQQQHL